jgi:hypothetical protein
MAFVIQEKKGNATARMKKTTLCKVFAVENGRKQRRRRICMTMQSLLLRLQFLKLWKKKDFFSRRFFFARILNMAGGGVTNGIRVIRYLISCS